MANLTKILIAGGNGFIGNNLRSNFNRKMSVVSIDYSNNSPNKDFINLDLTNKIKVMKFAEVTDQFDVLIFLVGLAHAKGKGKDLPEFEKINYQTLVNLLTALDNNNKIPEKIIFASTISIYGEKYHQNIYDEDIVPKPFSPYAVTKLQAEQYLLDKYADKSWILRFAPVYSTDFLLNINRRTQSGSWFYKVGNGSKKLSLCNLENIGSTVQGILDDKVPAGIYNISDEKVYSYNDLLKYVNAKWVIPIPRILVKGLYYIGKVMNNIFLKENATKLISDNIFPSGKIRSFVDLPATLNDIKQAND